MEKRKLLLLLADFSNRQKNALAAAFSWMAEEAGWEFDLYYDSFRLGDHFGGGPIEKAERGRPFGSTFTGNAHSEHFLSLIASHSCHAVVLDGRSFSQHLVQHSIPTTHFSGDYLALYRDVAELLGIELPSTLFLIGGEAGEDCYLYPHVFSERLLALHAPLTLDERSLRSAGITQIRAVLASETDIRGLEESSAPMVSTENTYPAGDLEALSRAIASRWNEWGRGYFMGDPVVTSHFVPFLAKNRLIALYSEPLEKLMEPTVMRKLSTSPLVYGRMFVDTDALALSKLGGCWQLMDPGRPPFPAAASAAAWIDEDEVDLFSAIQPTTDEETLRKHAERGDILSSLVFWSGCLRELENFHRLFELVATTGFRCGVAVTSETFAPGGQGSFALIRLPVERGGVFPLVEPLLASSGLGFSLEAHLPAGSFAEHMRKAMERLEETVPKGFMPRGWWACLDTALEPNPNPTRSISQRPFGRSKPGKILEEPYSVLAKHRLAYSVSKTTGNAPPKEGVFILRQTAGAWRGWSPFYDVESIDDIKNAEKKLFTRGVPGWLLGTIDTCLWTFSYPHWERGRELKEMLEFITRGGRSGRLVNAHPFAVYRYVRFLEERGYVSSHALARIEARIRRAGMRLGQAWRKISRRR